MKRIVRKFKKLGFKLGLMKAIGYEAEFTCALRKKGEETEYTAYTKTKDFWYADPLIYAYDNKEYIFMEAFERCSGLGRIAVSEIRQERMGEPKIIISEDFHLSFPVIFTHRNKIYMIPETSTAHKVIIYECKSFPYHWEKKAELLEGRELVDIVPVDYGENEILFLASQCEKDSLRVKFQAFKLTFEDGRFGTRLLEDYNKTQDYSYFSRNAGFPGKNYLVLQKSTPGIYGYSIVFVKNKDKIPTKLEVIREIKPEDIKIKKNAVKHIIGTHTYSCTEKYEVIDIQYLRFNKMKWIERIKKDLRHDKTTTN